MSTATIAPPKPVSAPAPAPCPACRGEPQPCLLCHHTWRHAVRFDLGRTHAAAVREAVFRQVDPALAGRPPGDFLGYLWVRTRKIAKGRPTERLYRVEEFACDFAGRAFRVTKAGTHDGYRVLLPVCGGATCSCAGNTYEATGKANYKAFEAGGEQVASSGCVHADACLALLRGGWFTLEGDEPVGAK